MLSNEGRGAKISGAVVFDLSLLSGSTRSPDGMTGDLRRYSQLSQSATFEIFLLPYSFPNVWS